MKVDELKKLIDQHNYISFDIFDTLVCRDVVAPSDVHKWVELVAQNKGIKNAGGYAQLRMEAARKARVRSDKEITLDEIFDLIDLFNEEEKRFLKKLEIDFELTLCNSNEQFVEVFKYCISKKKKIYIISDMYIPSKVIEQILEKCGITGYQRIYVSSEHGDTKSNGGLYKLVLKENAIMPDQLLHIGDNLKSDIIRAKLLGIKTYRVVAAKRTNEYWIHNNNLTGTDLLFYNTINKIIERKLSQSNDDYYKFGYACLGPLIYGFSKWLLSNMESMGLSKIFFLAREGQFMQMAFDRIEKSNHKYEEKYLYVSRKSLVPSSISKAEGYDDIRKVLSLRVNETIEGFFDSLDMLDEPFVGNLHEFALQLSDSIEIEEFKKFIDLNIKTIQNISLNKKKLLLDYLRQENFNGKVAVVDIGWKGTMQNAIENIFVEERIETQIYGFYLGVRKQKPKRTNKKGYLYDQDCNFNIEEMCRSMNGLLELTFSAHHGSTKAYRLNEKSKIEPILLPFECTSEMDNKVCKIQKAALEFVDDLESTKLFNSTKLSAQTSFKNFESVGQKPKNHDYDMFKNFHGNNIVVGELINAHPFYYYLIHPKAFKTDLLSSGWKIGFLRYVLKVPLPYLSIFKILKHYKERIERR